MSCIVTGIDNETFEVQGMTRTLILLAFILVFACSGCIVEELRYSFDDWPHVAEIEGSGDVDRELLGVAKKAPKQLFERGLRSYRETVRDFECCLIRVERLGGILRPEQKIRVRFLRKPFSVYMTWKKNPSSADRVLYVAGKNEGKMLALPVLIGWLTGPVPVDTWGKDARKNSRRSIEEFGFEQMFERILEPYNTGQLSCGGEFEDRFIGVVDVLGQRSLAFERVRLSGSEVDKNVAVGWRMCLSVENLLPVAVTEFASNGGVLGDYVFCEIRCNIGLKANNFDESVLRSAKKSAGKK